MEVFTVNPNHWVCIHNIYHASFVNKRVLCCLMSLASIASHLRLLYYECLLVFLCTSTTRWPNTIHLSYTTSMCHWTHVTWALSVSCYVDLLHLLSKCLCNIGGHVITFQNVSCNSEIFYSPWLSFWWHKVKSYAHVLYLINHM